MMSSDRIWTDAERNLIKQLRAEGVSVLQIGVRLRASKNQISGQLARMAARGEIQPMPSPIKPLYGPPRSPGSQWKRKAREAKPPKPKKIVIRKPPPPLKVKPAPVFVVVDNGPFVSQGPCQFIMSYGRPWKFCDAPVRKGVYCDSHRVVTYKAPDSEAAD